MWSYEGGLKSPRKIREMALVCVSRLFSVSSISWKNTHQVSARSVYFSVFGVRLNRGSRVISKKCMKENLAAKLRVKIPTRSASLLFSRFGSLGPLLVPQYEEMAGVKEILFKRDDCGNEYLFCRFWSHDLCRLLRASGFNVVYKITKKLNTLIKRVFTWKGPQSYRNQ